MDDVGDKIMPSKHDGASPLKHHQYDQRIIRYIYYKSIAQTWHIELPLPVYITQIHPSYSLELNTYDGEIGVQCE